ncbi:hypothetical protein P7C70_g7744, partial [Phenoliferia sp. Uapishka_3]
FSPAAMTSIILESIKDGTIVKQFRADQGTLLLGRGSRGNPNSQLLDNPLFRSDETKVMSQRHAELTWEDDRYPFLTDIGSTNGTAVERDSLVRKLKPNLPSRLKEGDIVTLGKQMGGFDQGATSYEPMSLLVKIIQKPNSVSLPSFAARPTTVPTLILAEDDSDDEGLPPPRQSYSGRTYSRASETIQLEDDDDDDSEFERPMRRRGGYGLSTPDILELSDDEIEVVDMDRSESEEPSEPEGVAPEWSPEPSPFEATQAFVYPYGRDESVPGLVDYDATSGEYEFSDGAGDPMDFEADELPRLPSAEPVVVERDFQEIPYRELSCSPFKPIPAIDDDLIASKVTETSAPSSPSSVIDYEIAAPDSSPPRQTFGDFMAARALKLQAAKNNESSQPPAASQASRLPSPLFSDALSFPDVGSRSPSPVACSDNPHPHKESEVVHNNDSHPSWPVSLDVRQETISTSLYSGGASVDKEKTFGGSSHLPSPSSTHRDVEIEGPGYAHQSDVDSDLVSEAALQADVWNDVIGDTLEMVDDFADAPNEEERDDFLDDCDDMAFDVDVDVELQAPTEHMLEHTTSSPLAGTDSSREESVNLSSMPLLARLSSPPPCLPEFSPEPEPPINTVEATYSRKRTLAAVDFETETDPVEDVVASCTLEDVALPQDRQVAPLPKRRKLAFGLKHLAFSSAVGFIAGTVVTVAGLASLEGMFSE